MYVILTGMKEIYPLERKKVRLNFYLTRQTKAKLEAISKKKFKSTSAVINEAVETLVRDWEKQFKPLTFE